MGRVPTTRASAPSLPLLPLFAPSSLGQDLMRRKQDELGGESWIFFSFFGLES